jgi:ribosomal protein L3
MDKNGVLQTEQKDLKTISQREWGTDGQVRTIGQEYKRAQAGQMGVTERKTLQPD